MSLLPASFSATRRGDSGRRAFIVVGASRDAPTSSLKHALPASAENRLLRIKCVRLLAWRAIATLSGTQQSWFANMQHIPLDTTRVLLACGHTLRRGKPGAKSLPHASFPSIASSRFASRHSVVTVDAQQCAPCDVRRPTAAASTLCACFWRNVANVAARAEPAVTEQHHCTGCSPLRCPSDSFAGERMPRTALPRWLSNLQTARSH
jgi:hypothetical protein